jgi:hypothetical protein
MPDAVNETPRPPDGSANSSSGASVLIPRANRWKLILAVLLLYGIACILTAGCNSIRLPGEMYYLLINPGLRPEGGFSSGPGGISWGEIPGYSALMLGWLGWFCVPWSANIILLIGLVCVACGKLTGAKRSGLIAVCLAITTWIIYFLPFPDQFVPLEGSYFWLGSMILLWLGARKIAASANR